MPLPPVNERLRLARVALGEDLAAIAHRIGVRESLLAAIEDGQFCELPRGIYGRAAIRSYAVALQLDAAQVLADCDALLTPMDDPIESLARLRGVRTWKTYTASEPAPAASTQTDLGAICKPLAAAALDGGIVMALLFAVVVVTMIFCGATGARFGQSAAPAFGLVGAVLAWCYFACFGGVAGATVGERMLGVAAPQDGADARDLHAVLVRTTQYLTRDVTAIRALGDAVGRAGAEWHARMHSPTTTS